MKSGFFANYRMEASSKVGDMPGLRVPTCFICAAVGETLQTVWGGSFVVGLRFLYIEKDSGVALQTWLDSLEAQFRFRESAQRTC